MKYSQHSIAKFHNGKTSRQRLKQPSVSRRPKTSTSISLWNKYSGGMIPITEPFHELLVPIKDPAKSIEINIAELLQLFIKSFINGQPVNFNCAALVIQGCSSIYGKKVEYLYNLATQLYHTLCKKKKEDANTKEPNIKKTREKKDTNKFNDPFFPVDIKLGKNLSCLRKKNTVVKNTNKKVQKKLRKRTFVPVNLLPYEGEEKGDIFYDTRGEAVGHKADFHLNKCKVTSSGWLLLPTVNEDQIPADDAQPDYSFNEVLPEAACSSGSQPQSTPDEGIDACSEITASQQTNNSPEVTLSQQTDEGLGSIPCTPLENPSQDTPQCSQSVPDTPDPEPMEGIESASEADVDVDDIGGGLDFPDDISETAEVPNKSVRRSMRQSKRLQEAEVAKEAEEEMPAIKKAIQKKNTCHLPSKLKASAVQDKSKSTDHPFPVDAFCARTFFSVDNKWWKIGHVSIDTDGFAQNSCMEKKFLTTNNALNATRKKKAGEAAAEEDEDENPIESLNDPDPDDMMSVDPLDDDDIVITADPEDMAPPDSHPPSREISQTDAPFDPIPEGDVHPEEAPEADEPLLPDNEDLRNLRELEKDAALSAKVRDWQDRVLPFLTELSSREKFDIHKYGTEIINFFDEGTSSAKQSKQTKHFRHFCKGKPKWLIHRYFMSLLPLENIGNVTLEMEQCPDGEEEILVTLLSRQMHHDKLEEFDVISHRKAPDSGKEQ